MKIKGITRDPHGLTDFSYIPLVLMAPTLAGFEANTKAAAICRTFGITVLGYSLFTDAKWGIVKRIPYKTHAALDLSSGILAFAVTVLPQISKSRAAKKTFLAMGVTGLVVGVLSLIGSMHD